MRTLQSQVRWTTKAQWVMTAVMAGLAVGFYVLAYGPPTKKRGGRQAESRNKHEQLQAAEARARMPPAVESEVEQLKQRLDRFDKKLPRQQDLPQVIKDITQVSQQEALKKLTVQPG